MNEIKLSKRLKAVADYVDKGAKLADIGSDHAYLPTYLVQKNEVEFAVAGEVVKGPFEIAKNHVAQANLKENIQVRLANGLAAIENVDKIDTIVIAGMGGILISEILEAGKGKLSSVKRLILQANNHEDTLRQWLTEHQFVIKAEQILLEAGKFYEIIVAEPTTNENPVLSANDLLFGPFLSKEKSVIFQQKWQKELNTLNKIIDRIPDEQTEKREEVLTEIAKIKEVLQ
ncbi:Predicted SAM-dependent methyltransferase [Lactococcus cremoris subsp. cremoris SK11]|uniref:Predicted SAM-dependent methyltransferase n=2 Tax=Lactococcus lactis subsp. cremoris TaxID=1359 RepID=Q02ZB5_LACLS|nr:tRNA (adenine(22)-N(1))-methyltransferase TrmK [Lactococcus cremoris]ABJ72707.1 Predicted SAM-dependent methyltransferase [Lactococcus cremoris subsp. cremoris SK11]ARE23310.1 tRNA (adenine(22)-N(1))-methyltransferase TrmK [Lactococcus cremoris]KZK50006.1 putative tRNA-m1A22 methylase [Lactococcus cremoris]KZK50780.1 putative tRNA-m1A22 methylase [Lactococcus cremoris]MCT4408363.1 tRNA (adenine-N(1))-methyltransferase [Lactococcus cremoris]